MKNRFISITLSVFLLLAMISPVAKAAEGDVCRIGDTGYISLSDALAAATDGCTITLLTNINHTQGIIITDKFITFDVGDFILNVNTSAYEGLKVSGAGGVGLINGTGQFNVTGNQYGVYSYFSRGVTVTNATATSYAGWGVYAAGGSVTVLGNAQGQALGVHCEGSNISIAGNAIATRGYYYSDQVYGVSAYGGTVTVGGNVQGSVIGIYARNSSNVTVNGDAAGNTGVQATSSTVNVGGSVRGQSYGVYSNAGHVTVNGNVQSNSVGAFANFFGTVRINGTLSAPTYIEINMTGTLSPSDGVVDGDYYRYRGYNDATVYVNIPPTITGLSAGTASIPSVGGSSVITVSGLKLPSGGVKVTAFDGDTATGITGISSGSAASQAVTLSFPASGGITKTYTIKASLNGGTSWDADTAAVSVKPFPVPVTSIAVSSESGATSVLNGNELQMSATVLPDDADYKQVTWNVEAGTGNATIAETGLLAGTAEGTVTVKAAAADSSGIVGTTVITVAPKPVISGTVVITGAAIYNGTLTADISGLTYTPSTASDAPTYQWKRNGEDIPGAVASTYKLVQADIGSTITVTITADGINAKGSVTSNATVPVEKADGPAAPAAPTLWYKFHNRIGLNYKSGIEYRMGDCPWQNASEFSGLIPETAYTFTARVKETATHKASSPSESITISTNPEPVYNVTYLANSGSGTAPTSSAIKAGASFTAAAADSFTPPVEKHFLRWNTKSDGTGTSYEAGAPVSMPVNGITLYAIWEINRYSVTYHSNYPGSEPEASFTEGSHAKDEPYTIAGSDSFTASDEKYFLEWNTSPDATGTFYTPGSTIGMPSGGLTLYAIWDTITYPVTYDANGGSGTVPTESDKAKAEIFTAADYNPERLIAPVEKHFLEWNTESDGSGTSYTSGAAVIMPSGGLTLYAIWETNTYNVKYDANGGSGTVPAESCKAKGDTFEAAASDTFAPPNVEIQFLKWCTDKNGTSGISYYPGDTITMPSGSLTLYAIWIVKTYPITYYGNGGSGTAPTESAKAMGTNFTAAANTFIPESGKRFKEWNTQPDGKGIGYAQGTEITMPSGELTLYAIWEFINYTITYNANGGTGTVPTETDRNIGQTFTVATPGGIIAPFNRQFKEWNTDSYGTGISYAPGDVITVQTSNITLHAIWKIAAYTVTYDGNGNTGGSVPVDNTEYMLGNYVNVLWDTGDLSKPGYGFTGWNTQRDGTGDFYAPDWYSAFYMNSANVTLYAQWSPIISHDFTDPNFKQAVWEWLGKPYGSTPMPFTKYDITNRFRYYAYSLVASNREIVSLAGLEHFKDTPLKQLFISNNQLVTLPELPDKLESLYCDSNSLTSLPELPNTLTSLSCSSNKLISLPALPNCLLSLECNSNMLTSLPALPASLDNLHCSGNRLTSIPVLPSGLDSIGCFWNYINFAASPNKDYINSCSAATKEIYPQFRYSGLLNNIDMVVGKTHSLIDELYERHSYNGSTWEDIDRPIDPSKFIFSSSDPHIVAVDNEGILSALGDGSCKITAMYYGIDAEYTKVEFNVTAVAMYHVIYDANGAEGIAPAESDKAAGTVFAAAVNTFTPPEDMRFKEWNTSADGKGTTYSQNADITMPAFDLTLYAIWELIPTYTVTYDGNGNTGGSVPIDNNYYRENTNVNISGNTGNLVRTGYAFIGWNTENNGTGIRYLPDDTLIMGSANVILYAEWSPIVSNDFTDANFKQAIWEWIGNPVGSEPGIFSREDLINSLRRNRYSLDIAGRGITSLAGLEHFAEMRLYDLICSDNQLTYLPALPVNLRIIECNNNRLSQLPDLPDSLIYLACNNNKLTILPELSDNLQILTCKNNLLTSLSTLPGSLVSFDISCNYLKTISGYSIEEFGSLETENLKIYPQYKYVGRSTDISLIREGTYSISELLCKMSYDRSGWSEISRDTDTTLFSFSSSDYTVASVDSRGLITANGTGTCRIYAMVGGADTEYTKVVINVSVNPKIEETIQVYQAVATDPSSPESDIPVNITVSGGTSTINMAPSAAETLFDSEGTRTITMPSIPGVSSYTLKVPVSSITDGSTGSALNVSSELGSITLSAGMLTDVASINGAIAGITLEQGDKTNLPDNVKTALGDRPIIQLTLTIDNKQTEWNNPEAPVTVSIPYAPTAAELQDPDHIVVWYIDGAGNIITVPSGRYDPGTGTVIFTTTHFSHYAVAYVHKTFNDLTGTSWAKKPVEVLASKGIISGTGNGTFSPKEFITRADFIVYLIKALGLTAKIEKNFNDVTPEDYYYEAVGIAKKLGITSGTGRNRFSPNAYITRQDMMVLAARTLEAAKRIQLAEDTAILDKFKDRSNIAGYAVNSIAALVREGLITGSGSSINPKGNTTRVDAAAFLYRIYNQTHIKL